MTSYEIIVAPSAKRDIAKLPEAVAAAILEFLAGPLAENPQRVGKPLVGDQIGLHSARRGTYRVIYRIVEHRVEVNVVRVRHRADAYRRS